MESIRTELEWWHKELEKQGKLIEAQRLYQRTMFDLEMIKEIGYCHGIENYSRHFSGRLPGEAPPTLLDYLPHDSLMFIDESHQTVPQLHGMYHGDRSRKEVLVGARLPPAQRARQPPAHVRGVRAPRQPGGLCLGDARPVRADQVRRRGGRADHPAHRPGRSRASRSGPSRARWTTCWARSASAPRPTSACSSPR